MKTVIFIGRSGSGKGTQAQLLVEYLQKNRSSEPVFYSETGKFFREFITGDGYSHHLVKDILDKGGRAPDFLAIHLWSHAFVENLTGNEHLIIDGTPRSLREAEVLDAAISFYERRADVLHVDVKKDEAIKRLQLRGRADDKNISDIERRLAWFEEDVAPAIEYYKRNSNYDYHDIDGERSVKEIHQDIVGRLFS